MTVHTPRYQLRAILLLAVILFLWSGCATSSGADQSANGPDGAETSIDPNAPDASARPPASWVDKRVAEAESRLSEDRAGRILLKSIKAHGGLKTWYRNGPLRFRYDYVPQGDGTERDTLQTVDTWRALARHSLPEDASKQYGWNGDQAWKKPSSWKPGYDVRFWALTPYYFVGMPFVLADPGVNLTHEGRADMMGHDCHVIRATFGEVGISPDDFYVLYIDAKSGHLHALRYIVSYPKYFPEGGHSPEKLMTYDGRRTVDGITFADSYRFFMWDPKATTDAKVVTRADLSNVSFEADVLNRYFDIPDGAKVVE